MGPEIRLQVPVIRIQGTAFFCGTLSDKTTANMSILKILIIVTNISVYADGKLATGLWLSELTHIYRAAQQAGYEVTIASPKGGKVPVDPESLKRFALDKIAKAYWQDPAFRDLLEQSRSLKEIQDQDYDLVYLAGGHGTMYDFPDDALLQTIIREQYEKGKMVAAICHGVGGLLQVKGADGEYLVKGKTLTGFNWCEERLARRRTKVPFNLEAALKERGADYKKSFLPMTSNVVVDKQLITGQNPFSSKEMARVVLQALKKINNTK